MFERFKMIGIGVNVEWLIENYSLSKSNSKIKPNFRFEPHGESILEALTPLMKSCQIYSNKSQIALLPGKSDLNNGIIGGIFFDHEKTVLCTYKPAKFQNFLEKDLNIDSNKIEKIDMNREWENGDTGVWYHYINIGEGLSVLGKMIKHKEGEVPHSMNYGVENGYQLEFDDFKYFREMEEFWERKTLSNLQDSRKKILDKICLVFSLDYDEEKVIEDIRDFEQKEQSILNKKYRKAPEIFDNFIEKYGIGGPEDRKKLNKLLLKKDVNLTEKEILLTCRLKWEEKQKSELKQYLEEGRDDYISKFIKKYNVGDLKSRTYLAEILDKPILDMEKTLKQEYLKTEEENELEEFEKELLEGRKSKNPLEELQTSRWDWEDINQMEGLDFERVLSEIFERLGYEAEVTQGSGDQGADLIIRKNGEKTVVQAKRYSDNVSNSAIQEVVASKEHYNAEKGMVVTTSDFTSSAESLARSNDIKLWNGSKLRKELNKI